MSIKKKGLGRGLDQLLSASAVGAAAVEGADYRPIAVELIHPSPYQPRRHFEPEALARLADSIRAQGLIQPIVVRRRSGEYELIAGERRWRAAQLAGLAQIPALVRELDDHEAAALALIENLQREDLDPIEQATAMRRLIEEFAMTHQQVADVLGVSRPAISNALRLLDLAPPVQAQLQQRLLDAGHARALATLPADDQAALAEKIIARALTVRQVEQMVRQRQKPTTEVKNPPADPDTERLMQQLSEALGVRVSWQSSGGARGVLRIAIDDPAQLDALVGLLLPSSG
ncbi:ParB/RepB/Spo0J family partition protein [Halothiobacillus sp. DCM-1]|uniref:ParB/RepB/Spo0J family partition protein n=1 Tax=Halothiobacillus sp. DCM-1 TaxID=3112558 RepID=UPI00324E0567